MEELERLTSFALHGVGNCSLLGRGRERCDKHLQPLYLSTTAHWWAQHHLVHLILIVMCACKIPSVPDKDKRLAASC